ncbi:MAG: HEAT repeat domain-containing protein [Armatimonadota bacterium]
MVRIGVVAFLVCTITGFPGPRPALAQPSTGSTTLADRIALARDTRDATAVPWLISFLKSGEAVKTYEAIGPVITLYGATTGPRTFGGNYTYVGLTPEGESALGALVAIAAPAVEPLVSLLTEEEDAIREGVADALGRIPDRRAVQPLAEVLERDPAWRVRRECAEALGKLQDGAAVEPLLNAAQHDPEYEVRSSATNALGHIPGEEATEGLVVLAHDPHPEVRASAVEALGRTGDVAHLPLILEILEDGSTSVRAAAVRALALMPDPDVVRRLILFLKGHYDEDLQAAIWALGESGDPRAVEPLIRLLRTTDRRYAQDALFRLTGHIFGSAREARAWWRQNRQKLPVQEGAQ